jgi:UDP-GlcNAc:undecaprenyl-phosphate/decaprenyl-phosphate GlcNAc-1-phosphate transferase
MTLLALLTATVVGALGAAWEARLAVRWSPPRLMTRNYAGRPVAAVLGIGLFFGILLGFLVGSLVAQSDHSFALGVYVYALISVLAWVGLLDDLYGGKARGIVGHLGSLARRRPTTGILKLLAGVAAAIVLALYLADDLVRVTGIAVLVALCTNLWNALDVVPGRALKWAAVVLIPVLAAAWARPSAPALAAALGSVLALLPFDLRERGMLGDTGSNPLGFLVGLGLAVVLPTPGLLVAVGAALLLQVAAETVTISRLIQAVPPLRWFDDLGRRRVPAS